MELILDTADARQVSELSDMLTITGVTTNPTIITRSGRTPEEVADSMLSVLSDDQLLFMQEHGEAATFDDVFGQLGGTDMVNHARPVGCSVQNLKEEGPGKWRRRGTTTSQGWLVSKRSPWRRTMVARIIGSCPT